MNSPITLDEIHVAIDDYSFHTHSQRIAYDPTGVPVFPPEEGGGHNFTPFNIEYRDFHINILPLTPLELFQYFIPKSLILSWIQYTESWVLYLLENGVIDSWNTPISNHLRITKWEGLSSLQVYVWLGVLIYLGVHRENTIASHWNTPSLGVQAPLHSIIKFMPLYRFQLILRYLRTFDYTTLDLGNEEDLPKVFQAAEPWSDHIQKVSAEFYTPGTNVTVDECMVPFTGRSKETTLVKGKPTPVGFKVWVIAQNGFFLRWLWHVKESPYTAVIIKLPKEQSQLQPQSQSQGKKRKPKEYIALSNTQSVVIHLYKMLPKATYHVFTDNLFSLPNLFRTLRETGYGATGIARPNCGIAKQLKDAKENDKAGKGPFLQYNEV
jgi:hypothetical protein